MNTRTGSAEERKMTSIFERYLTLWVGLCIIGGILLGKAAPDLAKSLNAMSISVNGAPIFPSPSPSASSL